MFEGEKFEADLCLVKFSDTPKSVTVTCENEILPSRNGAFHYSKIENTTGLKKIKAEAKFKNPFTGEEITQLGYYEYNVIPKCRQNCQ